MKQTLIVEMGMIQKMKTTFTPATLLAASLLGTFCVWADHFIAIPEVNSVCTRRAMADSLTHGIVGLLTWAIVMYRLSTSKKRYALEVMVCGMAASALDVDHFIAAKSLHLKDALSLTSRPLLHSTTLILIIAMLLYLSLYLTPVKNNIRYTVPLLFLAAWLSHHVRDATRRGLWVWPYGSTSPIPYRIYIGIVAVLPFLWRFLIITCQGEMDRRDNEIV
ncbi:transmembrane protein 267-like [Amphiura filiformis]|uniref:transmembrane protein 267-like n=1 Tax=Amphiura filiformis TaxID=82378 RepID=UPI003B21362B